MTEPWLAALRGQYQDIEGRLADTADPAGRDAIKRDIIALFKRVDGALTDLGFEPRRDPAAVTMVIPANHARSTALSSGSYMNELLSAPVSERFATRIP